MSAGKGVSKAYLKRVGIKLEPGDDGSELEAEFAKLTLHPHVPTPTRENALIPGRKYRCDFVWLPQKVIFEVEGGIYTGGRHVRPEGFNKDCEKYNMLTLMGYRVFRVTVDHIRNGQALEWLLQATNPNYRANHGK